MKFGRLFFSILISGIYLQAIDAAPPKQLVNGVQVDSGELPYMVQIKRIRLFHLCGGALLSEKHVLTAAHCVNDYMNIPNQLSVTSHSIYLSGCKGKDHDVKKIIQHGSYDESTSLKHDIAVIKLKTSVVFSNFARPVKLPEENVPEKSFATISGWGRVGKNKPLSLNLQKLTVTVVGPIACQQYIDLNYDNYYFKDEEIFPNELCGFTFQNRGYGTCDGDSGSPLVRNGYVIGIVSSGIGDCGQEGIDLYTNVYSYIDFIKAAMKII